MSTQQLAKHRQSQTIYKICKEWFCSLLSFHNHTLCIMLKCFIFVAGKIFIILNWVKSYFKCPKAHLNKQQSFSIKRKTTRMMHIRNCNFYMLSFSQVWLTCIKLRHIWPMPKFLNCSKHYNVYIRTWCTVRNAHYKAVKAKSTDKEEAQKMRGKPTIC